MDFLSTSFICFSFMLFLQFLSFFTLNFLWLLFFMTTSYPECPEGFQNLLEPYRHSCRIIPQQSPQRLMVKKFLQDILANVIYIVLLPPLLSQCPYGVFSNILIFYFILIFSSYICSSFLFANFFYFPIFFSKLISQNFWTFLQKLLL